MQMPYLQYKSCDEMQISRTYAHRDMQQDDIAEHDIQIRHYKPSP